LASDMRRLFQATAVAVIAVIVACAPLRELGGQLHSAYHPTRPGSLAPDTRLARAARDPGQCQALLLQEGVVFTPVRDQTDGRFCDVRNAILLGAQPLKVSPVRPMMACPLAAAFLLWSRYWVEPAARDILHTDLKQIDHFGVYACRRVNSQPVGNPSAHARAEAIDVAAFRLANGKQVKVLGDWTRTGPESQFLHRVRDDGCRAFATVLSPDYNALHANHLHLEIGGSGPCG
jgi:hypothetical protein